MKKKNFEVYSKFWCDSWVEALVEEIFSRLEIKLEEVCIYDMDEKRIYCQANVWDDTLEPEDEEGEPGDWDEKLYTIKYYIDSEPWEPMLLSFEFYDYDEELKKYTNPDGSITHYRSPRYINEGEYKIVSRRGKVKCIKL